MEIWVDPNNDGVKVNDFVDSGGWGSAGEECGGAPDQIISWGGPIVTYSQSGSYLRQFVSSYFGWYWI
jgi:hypothetical protein